LVPAVRAQTFTYNTGDLVAAFRESGSSDLLVDLGPVTTYETPGASFSVSQVTSSQLNTVFGTLNSVTFSVFGTQGSSGGVGGDSAYTSYLTLAETTPGTQTTALNGYSPSASHSIASQISGILGVGASTGALIYAPNASYPPSTSSGLVIPTTGTYAVDSFTTKFTGTGGLQSLVKSPGIENTTSSSFATTPGATAVSDLYAYAPGTATTPGTFEGSFTLNNSGQLTFTPASVPEPGTLALAVISALGLAGAFARRNKAAVRG
jgi:hypothetical protein